MRATHVLRLDRHAFEDATTLCLGVQISAVVAAVGEVEPTLVWYAADVQVIGPSFVAGRHSTPILVGDNATAVSVMSEVDQFESGVLVGVPCECSAPIFRQGGLLTEDDELADLGDAIVQVRAFDTIYVSFRKNAQGQIYRYQEGPNGTAHHSGTDGVGPGIRNLTQYAIDLLGGR